MRNYLLEIGTEELPPKAVEISLNYFSQKLPEIFKNFFEYDTPENVEIFASPRRVGFLMKNLKEREPSQEKVVIGPPAKVAIDENGKFTKAALAFASKNDISVEQLQIIENEKGRYVGAKILIEGKKLENFIKEKIPPFILSIPFPKTMRWDSSGIRFSRPIRWIVSLLDKEVIEIEIGNIKADRYTYLHRFMTEPVGKGGKKEISEALKYKEITKLGFVIADFKERRESIKTQIEGFAKVLDAQPIEDDELLDEVTNLTEFPIGILGEFSPQYLILPKEVIVTVCKVHQRYFNFERNGNLIPKFLAFSNNSVPNREIIKNGYEKVLKARLEDALFFYEEDLKHRLEEFYPKLRDVQFHQKLGSLLDKVERNERIALLLSEHFKDINVEDMVRACRLSKCDILTEMVKEFDELQGIMGMHYALKQGEKEEVAKAIYEHYLPKTADDNLPQTTIGTVLALADKLDTVISFLSIGEKPKAAADPYGIRRSAIGIVRLLVEKGVDIDLKEILDLISEEARKSKILKFAEIEDNWKVLFDESIIPEILEFITGRFVSYMKDKGYDTDVINAVISTNSYNLYRNYLKIRTVQQLKKNPQFTDIMTVFKRVGRIIPEGFEGEFSENFLKEKEEKELFEQFQRIKDVYNDEVERKDYEKALKELLKLKPYIDNFFDNVMVMVEDKRLRENRLSLMEMINRMFKRIADFTKIAT